MLQGMVRLQEVACVVVEKGENMADSHEVIALLRARLEASELRHEVTRS